MCAPEPCSGLLRHSRRCYLEDSGQNHGSHLPHPVCLGDRAIASGLTPQYVNPVPYHARQFRICSFISVDRGSIPHPCVGGQIRPISEARPLGFAMAQGYTRQIGRRVQDRRKSVDDAYWLELGVEKLYLMQFKDFILRACFVPAPAESDQVEQSGSEEAATTKEEGSEQQTRSGDTSQSQNEEIKE
ncbi:hypothetical protein QC761_610135 [Podospora bellae-mahoneyi]|uniref:Uncharacterized protein n=1 Tax=Podospora bellae-mahoneyi TaxID=2093777 RepID=A0ABR0FE39_9PEZI|nr:hypothetical protein QC761_610135 [Podospora bellae-mahoneyi]